MVASPVKGVVERVVVTAGEEVSGGDLLVEITEEEQMDVNISHYCNNMLTFSKEKSQIIQTSEDVLYGETSNQ